MGFELCSLCARVIPGAKFTVPGQPGGPGEFQPADVQEGSRLESLLYSRDRAADEAPQDPCGHSWALLTEICSIQPNVI